MTDSDSQFSTSIQEDLGDVSQTAHGSTNSPLSKSERVYLKEFLNSKFSLPELRDIVFDLSFDYENLIGDSKKDFVRNFIVFVERRNQLNCLLIEILKRRDDEKIANLLSKLTSCEPFMKVHLIIKEDLIENKVDLVEALAKLLNISVDEVMIIAGMKGSIRLIIGLPVGAAKKLIKLGNVSLDDNKYQIEGLSDFDSIDSEIQNEIRTLIQNGRKYNDIIFSTDEDNMWRDYWESEDFVGLSDIKIEGHHVLVENLPPVSYSELLDLFLGTGIVLSVSISSREEKHGKIVIVEMEHSGQAGEAERFLDGTEFRGRELRVRRSPGASSDDGKISNEPSPSTDGHSAQS